VDDVAASVFRRTARRYDRSAGAKLERGENMPIVFRLDHEARVVVAAAYGALTDGEVFEYQSKIFTLDEAIGYDELVDMTSVTEIALPSTDRVRDLASLAVGMDATHGNSKLAIVAPGDLAFALGRMFQTTRGLDPRSTTEVGVFRTMEDAAAFLRLERPLTLPTLP
jgi:hypothetical protein